LTEKPKYVIRKLILRTVKNLEVKKTFLKKKFTSKEIKDALWEEWKRLENETKKESLRV
jgi:hypothetical protein